MTTLAEQVAAIHEGDKVTATFKDNWTDGEFTVAGTVANPLNSNLVIAGATLTTSSGKVGDRVVSIDSHEPVLKVGDWVKVTGFVSDLNALVGEVVGLGPETVLVDFGPRGRVDVNPAYLTRTEKPAPPEPVKPAEPTEFGFVVKARLKGDDPLTEPPLWLRGFRGTWYSEDGDFTRYCNFDRVEVIRVGTGGIPAEARDALVSEYVAFLDKVGYETYRPEDFTPILREFADRLTGGAK